MLPPQTPAFLRDSLRPLAMDSLPTVIDTTSTEWLWHGLIARRNITLFTSQWKAGKTTLLTGLLQALSADCTFLNRTVTASRVLVLSEESKHTWADRLRRMPVGKHCQLLARPFLHRPTVEEWEGVVERATEMHVAGELDLLVVDPLVRFLPGPTESDLNGLLRMLDPLQRLTEAGAGVLILHHPRKKNSEEGSSARGSGGLLAAVDIIVELSRSGRLKTDECRRRLYAVSRYPETPKRVAYEWDPATAKFTSMDDPLTVRYEENWIVLLEILKKRKKASTHQELLMDWPESHERPTTPNLYEWLNRAFEDKRLRREGTGRKSDPYRYRLQNEDDEYRDRGELPPLRDLPWLGN